MSLFHLARASPSSLLLRQTKRSVIGTSWRAPTVSPTSITTTSCLLVPSHLPVSRNASTTATSTTATNSKSASKSLHEEMTQVLGTPGPASNTAAASAAPQQTRAAAATAEEAPMGVTAQIFENPSRKARYSQALWNAGFAFMVMMLSAQSLKSGKRAQKLQAELDATQATSKERLAVLQSLMEAETIRPLARRVLAEASLSRETTASSGAGWFGRSSSNTQGNQTTGTQQQQLSEDDVVVILQQELHRLVGDAAWDAAQKEAHQLQEIATPPSAVEVQQQTAAMALVSIAEEDDAEEILRALTKENEESGDEIVTRKKVFSM